MGRGHAFRRSGPGPRSRPRRATALVAALGLVGALFVGVAAGAPSAVADTGDAANGGLGTNTAGPGAGSTPGTGRVLIRITAGGDRPSNAGAISPLAGARYEVRENGGSPSAAAQAWCTTNATGQCWVNVPTRTSGGYVARQTNAPAGFTSVGSLRSSSDGTAGSSQNITYDFTTPNVATSTTVSLPRTGGTSPSSTTTGNWINERVNPDLPAGCSLNIGLLVDLSASVGSANQAPIRTALSQFVQTLAGTGTSIELHTFGTSSPANGAGNVNRPLVSVNDSRLPGWATGITVPSGEYTNWDAGLASFNSDAANLDAVFVLTDGYPTRYGGVGGRPVDGTGVQTRLIEVENSIASANYLKAQGVKVLAVGIGGGAVTGAPPTNLQVISGPTENTDYFTLANGFGALQQFLQQIAAAGCSGTVSVTKRILGPDDPDDAVGTPGAGWTMTATADASVVKVDDATSSYGTSAVGSTNDGGALTYAVDFTGGDTPRPITIQETQQDGFTLVPQGSSHAVCWTGPDNARDPVDVIDVGDEDAGAGEQVGFTVLANPADAVKCELRNRAAQPTTTLVVDKHWEVYDGGTAGDGRPAVFTGDGPTAPGVGGSATLTLGGNDGLPAAPYTWGVTYPGLAVGSTVAVGETVAGLPPLCTLESTTYSPALTGGTITLQEGDLNEVDVTNVVRCHTRLTLAKVVQSGSADPSDWTLAAHPLPPVAGGPAVLPGPSGTTGVSDEVTPGHVYALGEEATTDLARTYVQDFTPTLQNQWGPNRSAGSTGSWECFPASSVTGDTPTFDTTNRYDGRNGGVTVQLGGWSLCQSVNRPEPTLELVKQVDDDGTLTTDGADRWTLSAHWVPTAVTEPGGTPISPYPRTQDDVSGAGGFDATAVLPGTYELSESPDDVDGYTNGDTWACTLNGEPVAPTDGDELALAAGDVARCEIVNVRDEVPPPPTPTLTADVTDVCVQDAAYLSYDLTVTDVPNQPDLPVTATWRTQDGTVARVDTIPPGQLSGRLLWPGITLNADGVGIGWPGWRTLAASDFPLPAGATVYGDQIEDPALASQAYREPMTVTFEMNPSDVVTVTYPAVTPAGCEVARVPDLRLTKVASVERTTPGASFTFTIALSNVSELGAAYPVHLSDPVPSDLRVTGISTSTTAFPRWQDCAVTEADADGYGGTLSCDLFGALGPGAAAPDVVVAVIVDPSSPARHVVNTATVTWRSTTPADSEEHTVRASDDVDVVVTPPPPPPTPTDAPTPTEPVPPVEPPQPPLAHTGADVTHLGAAALALVLGGGLTLLAAAVVRRRRS